MPADPKVHHTLGKTLVLMGKTTEAEMAFGLALELAPAFLPALKDYAELMRSQQRLEEAISTYLKIILLDELDPMHYCCLGMVLQANGKLDEAMAAYRHMLEISPGNPVAHNNIGSVQQAQGHLEQARQSFVQALETEPNFADALCNLGICMLSLGRLEEALAHTSRAIELDPMNLQACTNMGSVLFKLGRNDETIEQCRQVLAINPQWQFIHSNLLFSLVHSEQAEAAALFSEHLRYAEQFEAAHRAHWPRHANSADPQRRLRIGIVSADLTAM